MDDEQQQELLALAAVGPLAALLRHAVRNMREVHPDGVMVKLDLHGLQVEFLTGDTPLYGLGFDA